MKNTPKSVGKLKKIYLTPPPITATDLMLMEPEKVKFQIILSTKTSGSNHTNKIKKLSIHIRNKNNIIYTKMGV